MLATERGEGTAGCGWSGHTRASAAVSACGQVLALGLLEKR